MKLLEMDRVKAVWNEYAANKIIVTIIKSENNWLKLKFIIHLINLKTYRDNLIWNWLEKYKRSLFSEREGESLQGVWEFAKTWSG